MKKLSFEHVSAIAHPEYYRGDHPSVTADEVPDEHWTRTERTGEGVDSQYQGLIQLMRSGELIRDAHMYAADDPPEPRWRDITPGGSDG